VLAAFSPRKELLIFCVKGDGDTMRICRICKKEVKGKGVMLSGYPVHFHCKEHYLRAETRRDLKEAEQRDE
jgi:hypothetical protein